MKLLYGLRNNILSFGCVSSFVDITDVTKRFGTEILNYNGLEFFKELDALTDEEKAEAKAIAVSWWRMPMAFIFLQRRFPMMWSSI